MGQIRQLDPHVADLIAAGEVVERSPANAGRLPGTPLDFKCSAGMNPACANSPLRSEFTPDFRRAGRSTTGEVFLCPT